MITTFDREIAQQVEAELKAALPDNQWSEGYLINIIEMCCQGNTYFNSHAGAFDAYLAKSNLPPRKGEDDLSRLIDEIANDPALQIEARPAG